MVQLNEYLQGTGGVTKLGYSLNDPKYIPQDYLDQKQFIIFRTCHSYGDWVILSAMPRLLKQKYPDCTVIIPSPECIRNYFSPLQWQNRSDNPFGNVLEIFTNNPYVDGMVDEIPASFPIYHDHFRIYDQATPDTPLIQQMLRFWRFEDSEIVDCEPELYWTDDEKDMGNSIIETVFGKEAFGFLYIDENFFYQINLPEDNIQARRDLIQTELTKHELPWLYFAGNDNFKYSTTSNTIDVRDLKTTLRIQNYIKSRAKVIIGHQGGYGTDCMSRYADCYVVPLTKNALNEHIQLKTKYLQ